MRCNGINCPNYDKCPINHEPVEGLGLSCDDWYECDDLVSFYLKMKEIEAKALKSPTIMLRARGMGKSSANKQIDAIADLMQKIKNTRYGIISLLTSERISVSGIEPSFYNATSCLLIKSVQFCRQFYTIRKIEKNGDRVYLQCISDSGDVDEEYKELVLNFRKQKMIKE